MRLSVFAFLAATAAGPASAITVNTSPVVCTPGVALPAATIGSYRLAHTLQLSGCRLRVYTTASTLTGPLSYSSSLGNAVYREGGGGWSAVSEPWYVVILNRSMTSRRGDYAAAPTGEATAFSLQIEWSVPGCRAEAPAHVDIHLADGENVCDYVSEISVGVPVMSRETESAPVDVFRVSPTHVFEINDNGDVTVEWTRASIDLSRVDTAGVRGGGAVVTYMQTGPGSESAAGPLYAVLEADTIRAVYVGTNAPPIFTAFSPEATGCNLNARGRYRNESLSTAAPDPKGYVGGRVLFRSSYAAHRPLGTPDVWLTPRTPVGLRDNRTSDRPTQTNPACQPASGSLGVADRFRLELSLLDQAELSARSFVGNTTATGRRLVPYHASDAGTVVPPPAPFEPISVGGDAPPGSMVVTVSGCPGTLRLVETNGDLHDGDGVPMIPRGTGRLASVGALGPFYGYAVVISTDGQTEYPNNGSVTVWDGGGTPVLSFDYTAADTPSLPGSSSAIVIPANATATFSAEVLDAVYVVTCSNGSLTFVLVENGAVSETAADARDYFDCASLGVSNHAMYVAATEIRALGSGNRFDDDLCDYNSGNITLSTDPGLSVTAGVLTGGLLSSFLVYPVGETAADTVAGASEFSVPVVSGNTPEDCGWSCLNARGGNRVAGPSRFVNAAAASWVVQNDRNGLPSGSLSAVVCDAGGGWRTIVVGDYLNASWHRFDPPAGFSGAASGCVVRSSGLAPLVSLDWGRVSIVVDLSVGACFSDTAPPAEVLVYTDLDNVPPLTLWGENETTECVSVARNLPHVYHGAVWSVAGVAGIDVVPGAVRPLVHATHSGSGFSVFRYVCDIARAVTGSTDASVVNDFTYAEANKSPVPVTFAIDDVFTTSCPRIGMWEHLVNEPDVSPYSGRGSYLDGAVVRPVSVCDLDRVVYTEATATTDVVCIEAPATLLSPGFRYGLSGHVSLPSAYYVDSSIVNATKRTSPTPATASVARLQRVDPGGITSLVRVVESGHANVSVPGSWSGLRAEGGRLGVLSPSIVDVVVPLTMADYRYHIRGMPSFKARPVAWNVLPCEIRDNETVFLAGGRTPGECVPLLTLPNETVAESVARLSLPCTGYAAGPASGSGELTVAGVSPVSLVGSSGAPAVFPAATLFSPVPPVSFPVPPVSFAGAPVSFSGAPVVSPASTLFSYAPAVRVALPGHHSFVVSPAAFGKNITAVPRAASPFPYFYNDNGTVRAVRPCDPAVQYEISEPTPYSQAVCRPLTSCGSYAYQSTAPTATSDRVCTPYSVCGAGQHIAVGPSASADVVCGDNVAGCAHGTLYRPPTNAGRNEMYFEPQCVPPPAGFTSYVDYEPIGTGLHTRQTGTAISQLAVNCSDSEYFDAATYPGDVHPTLYCRPCRACGTVSVPCGNNTNTVCSTAEPAAPRCLPGFYLTTTDNVPVCHRCIQCRSGYKVRCGENNQAVCLQNKLVTVLLATLDLSQFLYLVVVVAYRALAFTSKRASTMSPQ